MGYEGSGVTLTRLKRPVIAELIPKLRVSPSILRLRLLIELVRPSSQMQGRPIVSCHEQHIDVLGSGVANVFGTYCKGHP